MNDNIHVLKGGLFPSIPLTCAAGASEVLMKPSMMVRTALFTIGESTRGESIFDQARILERASVGFASYITAAFPGRRAPLLQETMAAAIDAYIAATERSRNLIRPNRAFFDAIASAAEEIIEYTVVGVADDGEETQWNCWAGGLQQAVKNSQWVHLRFVPSSPDEDARRAAGDFLMTRILSSLDYGRMLGIRNASA